LVIVACLGPGRHAPAVIAHQGQLASTSRALRAEQPATAIEHLGRAIEAMPIDPDPYHWQARLYMQEADLLAMHYRSDQARQRIDRALAVLDQAAAAGLDDTKLLVAKISVYDRAARWLDEPEHRRQAIALADQLLERSPFSVNDHRLAANLNWDAGRVQEAKRLYRRCLELDELLWLDPLRQLSAADRQFIEKRITVEP
jgi:tetratricopeptide (TPR) repeat protein